MPGPFWPDDGLPTPRTWCPPTACPVCRSTRWPSQPVEIRAVRPSVSRLVGHLWRVCRHKVYVCRFCGWPSAVAYGLRYATAPAVQCVCRLHFRPLTADRDAELAALAEPLPVDLDVLTTF